MTRPVNSSTMAMPSSVRNVMLVADMQMQRRQRPAQRLAPRL